MANLSNINNKFLVTTGGNVLIGQTSAVGTPIFQVTGKSTFSGNVSIGDATTDVATLTVEGGLLGIVDIWRNGTNASYNALRFRDATNTNTNASIGYGNNQLRVNAVNNMVFTTGASITTALTLDSSQNATFAGNVGIGVAPTSESNLSLGAKSAGEGGHLILNKGTSQTLATHIDNYSNSFRIMGGSDTASASVDFSINHSNSAATFAGNLIIGATADTTARLNIVANGETTYFARFKGTNGTGITYGFKTNGTNSDVLAIMNVSSGNRMIAIGENEFSVNIAGVNKLLLNSAGNAIFTGSVRVANPTQSNYWLYNAAKTNGFLLGRSLASNDGQDFFIFDTVANSARLTINSSGTSTFAGSVQINSTLGVSSNVNTSGLLTATAIDTNAFLSNGSAADLHGRYLGQAIYGSGTGSGDNYGTVADVLRYKDIAIWRKNSSTNVWSNPSDGDALVNGNYAHSWGGYNMDSAYSEYVFYFSNTLGYSFISQTIIQHSTNGNSFNLYIERASSTTNPYDTTGWTTMVTQTGIASWPGITCNQSNWEVGGGYPGLFRIRLVPTWNNGNVINIGSFQGYGSYGSFSHAWSTNFDRSVNFQSKIGVGTNPSRALDVTQQALIQGAGNVNMGTLALGPRASGVGKWSTISGAHYNQSSGGGNGSGAAGIMMIGTYGGNGENDIYIGGGPYEMNAATRIGFYTHTTDTSTAGGSERMRITSTGNLELSNPSVGNAGIRIYGTIDAGIIYMYRPVNSGTNVMRFYVGTTLVGNINTTNTAATYNSASDYRLKEDLQDFNGLDKVSKIPVYDFKWKTDESRSYGVMAHELQEVLPDAVSGDKDAEEMQGVDYSKIVPILVKAIQELKAEIELLKSK